MMMVKAERDGQKVKSPRRFIAFGIKLNRISCRGFMLCWNIVSRDAVVTPSGRSNRFFAARWFSLIPCELN